MTSEVQYGLIYVSELSRVLFPGPSQPVTVIDDSDGQKYDKKMHSFQSRIDGLTRLHRKHNTEKGQSVTIEVRSDEKATMHVLFGGMPSDDAHIL